ncbi:MAG: NAD(P)/FAD-dependent oxidoreductase [Candidatus Omnitrophota bacterium]
MQDIDVLIIGAGVVGLAVANQVSKNFKEVVVVEKNAYFGQETSSRNSEVIHAGMHYPGGTLKAVLCVEGRHLLYEICRKFNIPYKKTGKLTIATKSDEIPYLEKLFKQGRANGVEGLRLIEKSQIRSIEPNIEGIAGLVSSETGIIDSHSLMQYFYDSAKDSGAIVAFNSEVTVIEKTQQGCNVTIKSGNDEFALRSQVIINCAGLNSDTIAGMGGIDIKSRRYNLHYCKGEYFRVNNRIGMLNALVYPVPKPKGAGLGIHATLDLNGGMRLGPDDEYLGSRDISYLSDNSKRKNFFLSAREFMPFLQEDDLSPDTVGIRPKLQGPGEDFRDFIIQDETQNGFGGLINLIGIESPGLTASAAIGKKVNDMTANILGVKI